MDEFNHPKFARRRKRLTVTLASVILALIIAALNNIPANSKNLPGIASPKSTTSSPVTGGDVQGSESTPAASSQPSGKAILDAQPGLWHVTRDVDGDTIDVQQGSTKETVRLIGIDTPETHDPRKTVQCYGPEAAAHTKSVLEGHDVRLAPDPEDSDRDKYNRILRYVYLPDGTLYNAELVQDGWAFAYTVFPYSKLDEFKGLETQAQAAGRGLWAACNVNASQQIKQTAGHKS
jgi:micrococcal nuclease